MAKSKYTPAFYEVEYWKMQGGFDAQRGEESRAPELRAAGVSKDAVEAYRAEYADNVTTAECEATVNW